MAIFSIRFYHYNNMLLLSRENLFLFCEKKYLNVLKSHEVGQNVMLLNPKSVMRNLLLNLFRARFRVSQWSFGKASEAFQVSA